MSDTRTVVRLEPLREQRGLTQEQLARAADVSLSTVARLERCAREGRPCDETRVGVLVRLARALEVGVSDLLDSTPEVSP